MRGSPATSAPTAGGTLRWREAVTIGTDGLRVGAAYVGAYLLLDWSTFSYEWSSGGLTLWNPPPALTLAVLLTRGFRFLPWVFFATFAAEVVVRGLPSGVLIGIVGAAILMTGYGLLARAIGRWAPLDLLAVRPRDLAALLLAVPIGVLLVAISHVQASVALGALPQQQQITGMLRFWIGDTTGILTTLPLLLIVLRTGSRWREELRGGAFDFTVFLAATIGALGIIFVIGLPPSLSSETKYLYLLIPPIVWIAMRRSVAGSAIGVFIAEAGVFLSALLCDLPPADFQALQLLAVILASTGLLLGATVTSSRNAEANLRAQREEMDRVTQMTAFGVMGSALAHELSQPLSSITAASTTCQLLLAAPGDNASEIVKHLQRIDHDTSRAGRALRRIRNLAAIDRTAAGVIDITSVIETAVEHARRSQDSTAIRIVKPGPIHVLADPEQAGLVIANVLRNAIEATSAAGRGGGVTVTLRRGDQFAEILVDDDGAGIAPEIRDRLFEPYATTKPQGIGLGLAIAKSLVEMQGGRIAAAERRGEGARFIIMLPLANTNPP